MWAAILCAIYASAAYAETIVDTPSGRISGFLFESRGGRTIVAYKNIPYAEPPVGNLRFKKPKPYGRWPGVYRAVGEPPECIQVAGNSGQNEIPPKTTGSEDCLYLNVYRPSVNNNSLPVMFFIHGGAFTMGFGGQSSRPRYLLDNDVILVTVSYRLGAFGFLSLEDDAMPGNYGLYDQVLALEWVRNNIASFGGNPKAITLIGDSAGGACVHLLAVSPLTKDSIAGAIMMSGTAQVARQTLTQKGFARNFTLQAAALLDCDFENSEDIVECLQQVDAGKLVAISGLYPSHPSTLSLAPVTEPSGAGVFMPGNPFEMTSTAPWIITYSTGERLLESEYLYTNPAFLGQVMSSLDEYITQMVDSYGYGEKLTKRVRGRYFNSVVNQDDRNQIGLIKEDAQFTYGVLDNAIKHPGPTWLYHFEYRGQVSGTNISPTAVAHCDDSLFYIFDGIFARAQALSDEDTKISIQLVKYLTDFAIYGNPSPENTTNVNWKQWKTNEILRITNDGIAMAEPSFYREIEDIYDFWKSIEWEYEHSKTQ